MVANALHSQVAKLYNFKASCHFFCSCLPSFFPSFLPSFLPACLPFLPFLFPSFPASPLYSFLLACLLLLSLFLSFFLSIIVLSHSSNPSFFPARSRPLSRSCLGARCRRAPHPADVLWENLHISYAARQGAGWRPLRRQRGNVFLLTSDMRIHDKSQARLLTELDSKNRTFFRVCLTLTSRNLFSSACLLVLLLG